MSIPLGPRPRMYFHADDVPALRQRLERDARLRDARERFLTRAREGLTIPLPPESEAQAGPSQHGNYRRVGRVAEQVIRGSAFAYLLTGEEPFAERAVAGMRHFAEYDAWIGRLFAHRKPPWRSALENAAFATSYVEAIDFLGERLSEADRRSAIETVIRKGIEPSVADWLLPGRRIHALDSMGHNWWGVCVSTAALATLGVLGADNRAEGWLRLCLEGMEEFFRYPGNVLQNKPRTFDRRGGLYEGVNYTLFTLIHYVHFLAAAAHMLPDGYAGWHFDGRAPGLPGMIDFLLHMSYPRSAKGDAGGPGLLTVDFGDSPRDRPIRGDVTLALAKLTGDGRWRWYFERFTPQVDGVRQMLMYDPSIQPVGPEGMSTCRCLRDIGVAAMRSSWSDDATLLAVRSGTTWNHGHLDAGSFILYAGGEPLMIDAGKCAYGQPNYNRYFTAAAAHNVVLPAGRSVASDEYYRGSKFPGRLGAILDAGRIRYLLADATGPLAALYRRYLRSFLWLDEVIVIYDDLLAHEAGRFEWLFHGETPPQYADGRIEITSGAARLTMDVLFPPGLTAERRTAPSVYHEGPLDYLVLRAAEATADAKMLAVCRAGRDLPDVRVQARQGRQPKSPHQDLPNDTDARIQTGDGREWIAARIETPDARWDVYANLAADGRIMHANSHNDLDGRATDAYLLAERTETPRRHLLVGASYLRDAHGRTLFDGMAKFDAAVTWSPDGRSAAELVVRGPAGMRVRIASQEAPPRVVANGLEVGAAAVSRDGEFVSLRLPPDAEGYE